MQLSCYEVRRSLFAGTREERVDVIDADSNYSEVRNTAVLSTSVQVTSSVVDEIAVQSVNHATVDEPDENITAMASVSAVSAVSSVTENITTATDSASTNTSMSTKSFYGKTRSSGELSEPRLKRAKRIPSRFL